MKSRDKRIRGIERLGLLAKNVVGGGAGSWKEKLNWTERIFRPRTGPTPCCGSLKDKKREEIESGRGGETRKKPEWEGAERERIYGF